MRLIFRNFERFLCERPDTDFYDEIYGLLRHAEVIESSTYLGIGVLSSNSSQVHCIHLQEIVIHLRGIILEKGCRYLSSKGK